MDAEDMDADDDREPSLNSGLLDKLMQMQNEMKNAQDELAGERVTISVGGDAVQVVIDGQQRVHHITLSAEAVAAAQQEKCQARGRLGPNAGQPRKFINEPLNGLGCCQGCHAIPI